MLSDFWNKRTRGQWVLAIVALLLAATWAAFHGAARAEFLSWDDDINITGNPHVRGLSWENVRWMFTDTAYVRRYMPFGWLSWACQFQFFGANPASYHLVNILLHCFNAVLLFFILHRLLQLSVPVEQKLPRERSPLCCAAIGALLWAIHPLRVEPVAWASGRLYCQAILLLLLSLWAYLRYCESRAAERPSRLWFWSSVAAYAFSLFTYPLALAFIGILPILDLYPLRRFQFSLKGLRSPAARQVLVEKIPFAVVVALAFTVTLWARSGASGAWRPPPTLAEFSPAARIMQGFYVWAAYLCRSIVPAGLSPVYTALLRFDAFDPPFIASAILILGITVFVVWRRRRWPAMATAWCCYLLLLVPMLGLTEHPHYANDRYSYLPGLALSALAAAGLFCVWKHRLVRVPALIAISTASVVCGLMTISQVRAWHDTDALFLHIIAKMGDSPFRADTFCRLGDRRMSQGRWEEAKLFFADSTRVAPAFVRGYQGIGEALRRQGRNEEAVTAFVTALKVRTPTPDLLVRTAEALTDLGRYEEALQHYRFALDRNPGYGQAMDGLAWILATCPREELRNGDEAVLLAEKIASGSEHQVAKVESTLAAAYAEKGLFKEARLAGERALELAKVSGETNLLNRATEILASIQRREPYRKTSSTANDSK